MPTSVWSKTLTGIDYSGGFTYGWTFDDSPTLDSGPDWAALTPADWLVLGALLSFDFAAGPDGDSTITDGVTRYPDPDTPVTDSFSFTGSFDPGSSTATAIIIDSQAAANLPPGFLIGHTNAEIVRDAFAFHLSMTGLAGTGDVTITLTVDWTAPEPAVTGWFVGTVGR